MQKKSKSAVEKARPYFTAKAQAEALCRQADEQVVDLTRQVSAGKGRYQRALNNLNTISEEVHERREQMKAEFLRQKQMEVEEAEAKAAAGAGAETEAGEQVGEAGAEASTESPVEEAAAGAEAPAEASVQENDTPAENDDTYVVAGTSEAAGDEQTQAGGKDEASAEVREAAARQNGLEAGPDGESVVAVKLSVDDDAGVAVTTITAL